MTAAAFEHSRKNRVGDMDEPRQVDSDLRINITVGGHVIVPDEPPKARVIEEYVDPAVQVQDRLDHDPISIAVSHIHRDGNGLPTSF